MVHITGCLNNVDMAAKLLALTGKKAGEETVRVKIPKVIDILKLRQQIGLENGGVNVDLVLSYLKELGYLSNVKGSIPMNGYYILKLANEEVREELLNTLAECQKIVGFDFTLMQHFHKMFSRR